MKHIQTHIQVLDYTRSCRDRGNSSYLDIQQRYCRCLLAVQGRGEVPCLLAVQGREEVPLPAKGSFLLYLGKQIRLIETCFDVHNCSYIHAEVFLFKFTNILLNEFLLTSKWLFSIHDLTLPGCNKACDCFDVLSMEN